jgi:hypothetical protein
MPLHRFFHLRAAKIGRFSSENQKSTLFSPSRLIHYASIMHEPAMAADRFVVCEILTCPAKNRRRKTEKTGKLCLDLETESSGYV